MLKFNLAIFAKCLHCYVTVHKYSVRTKTELHFKLELWVFLLFLPSIIYPPLPSLSWFFSGTVITEFLCVYVCEESLLPHRALCTALTLTPCALVCWKWTWFAQIWPSKGSATLPHQAGLLPIVCFLMATSSFLLLFRWKHGLPLCHESLTGIHFFPWQFSCIQLLSPCWSGANSNIQDEMQECFKIKRRTATRHKD